MKIVFLCLRTLFLDYKWKKNRKLIQPYFAINVLESFVGIFVEHAEKTFEMLENYPENADVKISNVTNECIVKILHRKFFYVYTLLIELFTKMCNYLF